MFPRNAAASKISDASGGRVVAAGALARSVCASGSVTSRPRRPRDAFPHPPSHRTSLMAPPGALQNSCSCRPAAPRAPRATQGSLGSPSPRARAASRRGRAASPRRSSRRAPAAWGRRPTGSSRWTRAGSSGRTSRGEAPGRPHRPPGGRRSPTGAPRATPARPPSKCRPRWKRARGVLESGPRRGPGSRTPRGLGPSPRCKGA